MEPQNITAEYIGNFFKPAPDEAQRVFAKLERNEIGRNPKIVGDLLKQVYGQVLIKHSKLLRAPCWFLPLAVNLIQQENCASDTGAQ